MLAFLNQHYPHALLLTVARLATWLILVFAIFAPLEYLFPLHRRKLFRTGLLGDLGYYFINSLVPGLLLLVPLSVAGWAAHYLVPWRMQVSIAAWPLWERIVVGFVIGEVGFYWGHRWTHQISFLWRFHAIHHAPEHVYFLVSSRAHPIDNAFVRLCGLIPAAVLGVASPLSPSGGLVAALIIIAATVWGFLIHANVRWRLGPFEWLIATPAFHHWHHSLREPRDRNYAAMLPIMDWIFGTAYLPRNAWPRAYGAETKLPRSLVGQLWYPLRPDPPTSASLSQPAR